MISRRKLLTGAGTAIAGNAMLDACLSIARGTARGNCSDTSRSAEDPPREIVYG